MLLRFKECHRREDLGLGINVTVDVFDVNTGALRRRHEGHNLYTDLGLAKLAAALAGATTTITHFGLGSDDTAAAAGDTDLGAEVNVSAITRVTSEDEVVTAQYYLGSGQLNTETLVEAGLFAGDDLLARFVFDDEDMQPKTNAVAVVFTWTITMARAA